MSQSHNLSRTSRTKAIIWREMISCTWVWEVFSSTNMSLNHLVRSTLTVRAPNSDVKVWLVTKCLRCLQTLAELIDSLLEWWPGSDLWMTLRRNWSSLTLKRGIWCFSMRMKRQYDFKRSILLIQITRYSPMITYSLLMPLRKRYLTLLENRWSKTLCRVTMGLSLLTVRQEVARPLQCMERTSLMTQWGALYQEQRGRSLITSLW